MCDDFLKKDPFPEIEPALLNSADIEDYAIKIKMVDPFDPQKLKPASYEVGFEGIVYLWNEKGEPEEKNLENEQSFELKKNSIIYLFTKTKFRLPDYIALRFNLKITHVHRGILLGTGPLIDPGFEGNILIPLHNLTTNDYVFKVGEGLIWVEFTKISKHSKWQDYEKQHERIGYYKEFPQDKKNKDAKYYFGKAAMGKGIRSSIPDAMKRAAEDARQAKEDATKASTAAQKAEKTIKKISWGGGITIALTIMGLLISLYLGFQPILQLVNDSVKYIKDEKNLYDKKSSAIFDKIRSLEKQLDQIEKLLKENERKGNSIVTRINNTLESDVNGLKNKFNHAQDQQNEKRKP